MASITIAADGARAVQFHDAAGKRWLIRLGKLPGGRKLKRKAAVNPGESPWEPDGHAKTVKQHVEALLASKTNGEPVDKVTTAWLTTCGDKLMKRLAAVGLIAPRRTDRLKEFLTAYIDGRSNLKPRSRLNLNVAKDLLVAHFGADAVVREIDEKGADAWTTGLRTKRENSDRPRYAEATVGRLIRRARQFWSIAKRWKLTDENPFAGIKAPGQTNSARSFHIDRATAAKLIHAAPDLEWRLIIALSRFGGLRVPSEIAGLAWGDVDWAKSRVRITSPKTAHHEGKGERYIPIFPELRPHLEAVWNGFDAAPEATEPVAPRVVNAEVNLRHGLKRIIKKAGLVAWERLFHNMRASRQTELTESWPLHVVCAWLGNSAPIADAHYLTVRDSDFERAANVGPIVGQTMNAIGDNARQAATLAGHNRNSLPMNDSKRQRTSTGYPGNDSEQVEFSPTFPDDSEVPCHESGAESGAVGSIISRLFANRCLLTTDEVASLTAMDANVQARAVGVAS